MVVYSIYVLFMLSILIMTWVWCGGRVCMYPGLVCLAAMPRIKLNVNYVNNVTSLG
jgi:hypothetical protein